MFSWLGSHWRGIATLAVAAVAFTAVTVLTGGLGAPVLLSLAAGGFASGVAGYVTGELLDGRRPTVQQALVQGVVGAAITVATLGVGRVLAPVASRVLAPVARVIPRGAVAAIPQVLRVGAGNATVGAAFGTGVQAAQNLYRGRPVSEGLEDAALMGTVNGLLMQPATAAGQRLAAVIRPPAPLPVTTRPTTRPASLAEEPQPVQSNPNTTARRGAGASDEPGLVGAGGVEPLSPIVGESRTNLDAWNAQLANLRQPGPRVLTDAELAALAPGRSGPSTTVARGGVEDQLRFDAAARRVNDLVRSGEDLSIERLRELNRILLEGSSNGQYAGQLRTDPNAWVYHRTGNGGVFHYANPEQVPRYLDEFMDWYRAAQGTVPPAELAAQAYQQLVRIHPFFDSNGRTTRLAMDWILQRNGLPPATFAGIPHNAVHEPTAMVVYNVSRGVAQADSVLTRTVDGSAVAPTTIVVPAPAASRTRGFAGALGPN